jgi:uncharacterized repeat protein (TIGR04138 family)
MSQEQQLEVDWRQILAAGPYPIEAYAFVREGLNYTVHHVHEDPDALAESDRHISGQQLCLGLRESAIERWGLLAPVVLEHWKVRRTNDFGRIVYAMIAAGLMTRTSSDSMDDFHAVYDFDEAFCREAMLAQIARLSPAGR